MDMPVADCSVFRKGLVSCALAIDPCIILFFLELSGREVLGSIKSSYTTKVCFNRSQESLLSLFADDYQSSEDL